METSITIGNTITLLEEQLSRASTTSKLQIILKAISESRSERCSRNAASTITNVVRMELASVSTPGLVAVVENCVESIREDSDKHFGWKDVLPECLQLLKDRSSPVNSSGTDISGTEYVSRCLQSLCMFKWSESVVVPLAEMFRDIPMNKDEHTEITKKLCHGLENMTPDSVPCLLEPLLRFCKTQNALIVFYSVTDYFTRKLFPKSNNVFQDSETPIIDFDEIEKETSSSDDGLWKAHATCLYVACDLGGATRQFLNSLKSCSRRPSSILSKPPLIHLLLATTNNRDVCLELIRSAMLFNKAEEKKRAQFSWCMEAFPEPINVELLIKQLVDNSMKHCQMTSEGLLLLSSLLLSAGSDELRSYGRLLLTALARNLPVAMKPALGLIKDRLCEDMSRAPLMAGSLEYFCLYCPELIKDNIVVIQNILEDCFSIHDQGSNWMGCCRLLNSLKPIIKTDTRLRDTLVMLCRKGLFSRESSIGRIAIFGFLLLLKTLRTSNGECFSQDSGTSSLSILTQITIDVHSDNSTGKRSNVNNNAVCKEVVFQLRKCFRQTWEVKEQFYQDLPPVLRRKTEIFDLITELFYEHLTSKYCSLDEDTLPPVNLENCVSINSDGAILEEPLGKFLYCVQQLLADSAEEIIDEPLVEYHSGHALKLFNLVLQIATNMGKCNPTHFKLDDGVHLNDILPESRSYCLQIQQALQCCEALIAFVINNWTIIPDNRVRLVIDLHKTYLEMLDFTKTNAKSKKGDKNSKKSQKDKSILKSQEENIPKTASKNKKKETLKFSDLTKDKIGFKILPTVWDLNVCCKMLELLHRENVSWASEEERLQIQTKRDLHRTTIKFTYQAIKNSQSGLLTKNLLNQITECSKLIYDCCIQRLDDFCDFDQETALLAVECFQELIHVVTEKYTKNLGEFLEPVVGILESDGLSEQLNVFLEIISTQLLKAVETRSETDEPAAKKLPSQLLQLFITVSQHLPANSAHCDKWRQWLLHLSSLKSSDWIGASSVGPLLSLSGRSRDPWGTIEHLIKALTRIMGVISDESQEESNLEEEFPFCCLTNSTTSAALLNLCSHLNGRMGALEIMVGRLKAENVAMQFKTSQEQITALSALKNRELSACQELIDVSDACRRISELTCPPGNCCTVILKLLTRLHNILAVFATHFTSRERALLAARFDRAVRVSGRPLYHAIDALIIYIEGARDNDKNVNKGKILQDTKQIPLLVCAREQLCKKLLILSKKTKIDLTSHIPAGSARDFRIKASTVKEALESRGDGITMDTSAASNEDNNGSIVAEDEDILANKSSSDVEELDNSKEDKSGTDEENVPPPKKLRKN